MTAKKSPTSSKQPMGVRAGLWLDRKGRRFLGEKRIQLLERIDTLGSITGAAKAVGLSYKGAWDSLDAIENAAEEPVVRRSAGGRAGGGSKLTDHGRELVRLYRELESGHRRVLTRLESEYHDPGRLDDLLKAITLKTSARNQFFGKVTAVRRGAVNADVVLDLGDGLEIVANITMDAVAELGLKKGRNALALIKASFVVLATGDDVHVSAGNRLAGIVKKIVRGPVNSEVKVQLTGARTIVAVISSSGLKALRLREGSAVFALVNASHVLIAVND